MRRLSLNKILYRCNQSKLQNQKIVTEEPTINHLNEGPIKIETKHMANLLHPPKTGRQESIKSKMRK